MRTLLMAATAAALAASPLMAQEFVAPKQTPQHITTTPQTLQPSIEGIVGQVFKNKQALQMVNPLAPSQYGNGEKTISWDPEDKGKPKGFILFALQW